MQAQANFSWSVSMETVVSRLFCAGALANFAGNVDGRTLKMASKNNENTDENVPNKSETVSISTENVKGKEGKGKRKWSNSEIEKLIEEYEEKPCFWDVFTEDYHNIEKTSKAKEELSVRTQKYEDSCLVYLSNQFIYSLVNVFLMFSTEIS